MQAVGQNSARKRYVENAPLNSRTSFARRRRLSNWLVIIGCLSPALVLFFIFVLIPIVQTAYTSLYEWSGLGPLQNFVGLRNYIVLFKDPVFLNSIKDNLIIAVLSICLQLPFSLILALLIRRRMPGVTFFRTVFFLPYVLSDVVVGLIWYFIYDPSAGLISGIVKTFNPTATPPAFLADPHVVLLAIFVAISWRYFGFHLMLYIAGLQNIPEELSEAARMDGATRWQVTRHITLPLLASTIRLSVLFSIIGSLQIFDLIYAITNGGPVYASETMVLYEIHRGPQNFEFGYGSAVGIVIFIFCFVFALFYQRTAMRRDLTGAVQ